MGKKIKWAVLGSCGIAIQSQKVLAACYESARNGRAVKID
jgi:hypothetical protein